MHTCFPSNSKIVKEIAKNMKAMSLRVGKAQRRRHEGATEEAENPECRCEHDVEEEEVQVEMESSPEEGDEEEEESDEVKEREWIAEPEPGVLMTLVPRPDGRNHLKKIRFREELFDTWAAQSWWAENYERIVELYSIAQNRVPVTPYQSEEEVGTDQDRDSGTTSSCSGPSGGSGDTLGSPILGLVTAAGGNLRAEQSTAEWVEEYESGVFITVRGHPDGRKELRRVELSRERFGEVKARVWWEENKFVLQKLYSC